MLTMIITHAKSIRVLGPQMSKLYIISCYDGSNIMVSRDKSTQLLFDGNYCIMAETSNDTICIIIDELIEGIPFDNCIDKCSEDKLIVIYPGSEFMRIIVDTYIYECILDSIHHNDILCVQKYLQCYENKQLEKSEAEELMNISTIRFLKDSVYHKQNKIRNLLASSMMPIEYIR